MEQLELVEWWDGPDRVEIPEAKVRLESRGSLVQQDSADSLEVKVPPEKLDSLVQVAQRELLELRVLQVIPVHPAHVELSDQPVLPDTLEQLGHQEPWDRLDHRDLKEQ